MSSSNPIPLLQLPDELRNQIYTYLFAGTTLEFDEVHTYKYPFSWSTLKLPSDFPILRVCRQINQEARPIWLSQVLFDFETPRALLDCLSTLSSTTLSQIRHVRVHNWPFPLMIDTVRKRYYWLLSALELLPGLRLDTLTVVEQSGLRREVYNAVEKLIKYGTGWRELHFIHRSTWNKLLSQRNGVDSGASVTIYCSTENGKLDTVLDPNTRGLVEQKILHPEELEHSGVEADQGLRAPGELGKALLVIVKRGRDTDITEYDRPVPRLLKRTTQQPQPPTAIDNTSSNNKYENLTDLKHRLRSHLILDRHRRREIRRLEHQVRSLNEKLRRREAELERERDERRQPHREALQNTQREREWDDETKRAAAEIREGIVIRALRDVDRVLETVQGRIGDVKRMVGDGVGSTYVGRDTSR
ncbi:hypothetical protein VTN00DRAFT_4835 [Thermoascus crustaceus]|uniref:uncharacterized protein n=1 Tax=Thermoascus crustaceus TaxID=5088 RepID=UPI0037435172